MTWEGLMTSALVGWAGSLVAVAFTVYQGIRFRRWIPKRDVVESLEALRARHEEALENYEELREKIYKANEIIDEAKSRRDWLDKTKAELEELEVMKREFQDLDRKSTALADEVAKLDEELGDKRVAVEEATRQLDRLDADIARQRERLMDESEVERLQQMHTSLKATTEALRSEMEKLESTRHAYAETVKQLAEDVEAATVRRDRLAVEVRGLAEEANGLQARIASLRDQLEDIKQARLEISDTGTERHDESRRTALLWEPAVKADDYAGSGHPEVDEQAALRSAEDSIKAAGFEYNPRIIRAFHTALKCAEEAPMLVLAGISGTGKSALPTRYAEAIGMHLLNVAVQPGWDSPADLLGFYNHLEGRFRPTDLARALIQMDYVNRSDDPWPGEAEQRANLSDRMLLILLDEMNLARVEYYFSEFLSRLELRRGVDPVNATARRRAEVQLDLGVAEAGERQSLSIYAGENVLFVGTMNEDESTQTLSDKVIDRSNVIRFGRPKRLVTDGANAAAAKSKRGYLKRSTWSRWVQASPRLKDAEMRTVEGWIEQTNDALGSVGRPFAHRVAAAMRMYVQQYPERGSIHLKEAFADQVEFRVLPRLRGLDAHDPSVRRAIERIQKLLEDDLEDEALASELRDSLNREGDQLFHWSGIDRADDAR